MKSLANISGKIIRHAGRGRKLGYPTANLDTKADLSEGIYLGLVEKIQGGTLPPLFLRKLLPHTKLFSTKTGLPALIFVGKAETFGEQEDSIEVHILDFNHDIYDCKLSVEIIKKIRDNQKFETEEVLIEQMKEDELVARQFFASYNKGN